MEPDGLPLQQICVNFGRRVLGTGNNAMCTDSTGAVGLRPLTRSGFKQVAEITHCTYKNGRARGATL